MKIGHLLPALAVASSLWAAAAHAQTVITSLPYVISSPGVYVLNSNLNSTQTSGYLIEIRASNVTLDFQGHYITGPKGNTGLPTVGVVAEERSNVTVKNGTIAYCSTGISLSGTSAASTNAVDEIVDNMRVTYCFNYGIALQYCPASRIQNCQVSQIGYSGSSYAVGITAVSAGATVQNNTISTVTATNSYGITANACLARQNTISDARFGVVGGKYQDNLTLGCTTPFGGGTDAGGNN